MKGMDVARPIQQKCQPPPRRRGDRAVQRRASRPIAQVNEPRIGVEECAHLDNITSRRRDVDRVIGVGRPARSCSNVTSSSKPATSS